MVFIDHRQKDWLEWLVIAKFAINNKIYSATKVSLFMENYRRELRIRADIRRKGKSRKNNRICRENEKGSRES